MNKETTKQQTGSEKLPTAEKGDATGALIISA